MFDIGGVLVTEVPRAWVGRWEAGLGLDPGTLEPALLPIWQAGSVGAIGLDEVHRRVAGIVGDAEVFMEDVWEAYLGTPRVALTAFFAGLPHRRALLSNSFVGAREREAERYGFDAMVEQIVYSHEVGLQKPDPRIYLLTAERLGVEPDQMLFADDRAENVQAARELGIHAVLVGADEQAAIAAIRSALDAWSG